MREGRREGENYFLWRYERRVGNLVIISSSRCVYGYRILEMKE